ncbi:methyltransferase domain-containing protein [Desulfovibrio mangrovi]|uniref:class I SAM-dependent methyltransferase n=1 Tax=Desulfovibrio mangrovi TaxID=2976983 RepID=UPI0022469235|nr:methyltransferase domain-containing protein [Desulfovibrio mangrovi]UZP66660.1 methyltransferase domain-containing protein [Desulfovibrio mangrovi]
MGNERPSSFYDEVYKRGGTGKAFFKHYSESLYYESWNLVISLLKEDQPKHVLDIGCGVGQFAQMAHDLLPSLEGYVGVDFSETALEMAAKNCPQATFLRKNIVEESLDDLLCDFIVCLEVLEHIEDDLPLLYNLPKNVDIIFSVPNYDSLGHVRHFSNEKEVLDRYARAIDIVKIFTIRINDEKVLYVGRGTVKSGASTCTP